MVVAKLVAFTFDQLVDERDDLRLASCQILEHFKIMSVVIDGFVDDRIPDGKGNLKGLIHFVLGRTRTKRDEQGFREFEKRLGDLPVRDFDP